MIPLRLHLHNFLSYGEQSEPIDLDGIHVACLCGPNGHGKSSLLDAVTWVLWGQARSNSADDLIRHGQTSMWVDFEFLLDGQRYRAVRKRTRGKNSQSDLQLMVRKQDGEWNALTGQGVRGTQERIVQLLRMDYETFINSAFILQGRADELARKTPSDRKRILGEILSLGVYDQLCEKARLRKREAETRAASLDADIARMERDYARLPERRLEVERLDAEHLRAQLAVQTARAEHHEVLLQKAALESRRRERDDLARRLAAAEGELQSLRQQWVQAGRKVEQGEALVSRAGEIRAQAQAYFAACRERDELTQRLAEVRRLEGEQSQLQRRLQEARHRKETEVQLARQRVLQDQARAELVPQFERDLADLERQAQALDRLQEERDALQARLPELAADTAHAKAEQARTHDALEEADKRFQLLKGARAVCPLCDGELPEEKRLTLGRQLRAEKEALKEAQGKAIQAEADAKREDAATRKRLAELETKLRTGQGMRDRLAQVRQKHLELAESAEQLPREREILERLEAELAAEQFEPELRAALADVAGRLKALRYDPEHHRRLQARLQELAGAERELHALEQAEATLPADREAVQTLEATIRAREEAIAEDRAARAEADRELARLPEIEAQAGRLGAALQQQERLEKATAQSLGAAQEALSACEALGPQLTQRREEREAAWQDLSAYEELSKAFGRNGIQALIIENALPEIENEANALLARMSDGQLHVRLKTQRELRTGGQAETLEIEISDGLGARRYEMYSGGEAFRVNFALRIALSKLLARRAGARLETLVIDEGFGSQDQEGRMRLVEAIQAVQEDFARVLVITHLDDLKDAFPTRIEVTKGPAGSQVAVY